MTTNDRDRIRRYQQRLAAAYERFKAMHADGCSGRDLGRRISDFRDQILIDLWQEACDRMGASGRTPSLSILALGGSGRRDVAPFSDVDLMVLQSKSLSEEHLKAVKHFFRDVFDVGLQLGHSIRTVDQACMLAKQDAQICTSLIDARPVTGDKNLLQKLQKRFNGIFRGSSSWWISAIESERRNERARFGDSAYLLEPNVKRSSGGLRDLQFLRWIGKVRYGAASFEELAKLGRLTDDERDTLLDAEDFLLTLRNELHFHGDKGADVLDRSQQLRIAETRGYLPSTGLIPVERFMRDYFRRTSRVGHIVERFVERARPANRLMERLTFVFGHQTTDGFHVGPRHIVARRRALQRMESDWSAVVQLVDLANLYGKEIHPDTWEAVHRIVPPADDAAREAPLPEEAVKHFLSFLSHPGDQGTLLRSLHGYGVLERIIPQFKHARGLLQFNQYHKYTVDEHCIRAIERASEFQHEEAPIGRVYRNLARKHVLHLALLIHDLGKGYPEHHHEVGLRIARETAERLGLDRDETHTLEFLVRNHEMMNHLAFRRDTSDEELIVRFAVDVKSQERLAMLFVMTACDLAAVGPGVWDEWKGQVLTDLYLRTMQHLAGDEVWTGEAERLRDEVKQRFRDEKNADWCAETLDQLPDTCLRGVGSDELVERIRMLSEVSNGGVRVAAKYDADTHAMELTIATNESTASGIFHKLTSALMIRGMQILSAEIHTLDNGLILDRFTVRDPDFKDAPPPERITEIQTSIEDSLRNGQSGPTAFRRTWRSDSEKPATQVAKTGVQADNSSSDRYTILDIFANDSPGLLHRVAKALFDMGLSVHRAKVGTFIDQVVDVFYVVDRDGGKITTDVRLQEVRLRLLQEILGRHDS